MKLPRQRPQQLVFQWNSFQKHCQYWSDSIGKFFEEATQLLTKGTRYDTENGIEYCPDVGLSEVNFAESKAVGRGGRMIMYEERLKREIAWCLQHTVSIDYYVWRHRCYTKTCETEADIFAALANTCESLVVVNIITLAKYLDEKAPARIINNYGRLRGWHVPYTQLLTLAPEKTSRRILRIQQNKIKSLPIHYDPITFCYDKRRIQKAQPDQTKVHSMCVPSVSADSLSERKEQSDPF